MEMVKDELCVVRREWVWGWGERTLIHSLDPQHKLTTQPFHY